MQDTQRHFSPLQLILISAALLIGALVFWKLSHLVMLVFGAILIGVLLSALANGIMRISGLSRGVSLALSVLSVILFMGGFVYFMGSQLVVEATALFERLPDLATTIEKYTQIEELESWLSSHAKSLLGGGSVVSNITGFSSGVFSIAINFVLVLSGAVYFAINPHIYRKGFLALFPKKIRPRADEILGEIATSLKYWFIGQLVSMAVIGVVTTIGLLLLGIPSAFALGFIAGILEFVPYVGPIASAVPAVAVALSEGGWTPLWVILLYIGIQQAESILLTPLVQRKAVDLPPGLIIFAILAFGILFGMGGVVLGTPLTVVAVILVKNLLRERDRRRDENIDEAQTETGGSS
jgi:predicted PurR-regulated permease PerM